MKRRELLALLAAAAVILLADYPWGDFQGHSHWANVGWIPFASGPVKLRDVVNNVALGMPLGIASGLTFRRATMVAIVIAAPVAAAGEWIQVYSHSRFPSLTDLVCNLAGAAVAAYTVTRLRRRYIVLR